MALGSYGDFIKSMLSLREQRLEEEKLKQAERLAQQKQMMEMVGDIGSAITSGYNQFSQNKMANQLMTEQYGAPPRAQAVDPSMQAPADAAAARMPGFYTGGMPELKMRMGMAEDQSQAAYRNAMINRMGQNLELQKDKARVAAAVTAKREIDKDFDQDVKNENWYIKENAVYDSAIAKATTPEQWQSAVDSKLAVNRAAIKRGLKVEPFDPSKIAPFMSQDDRDALATQQEAVSAARIKLEEAKKAQPGWIDWTRETLGIPEGGYFGGKGTSEKEKNVLTAEELYKQEMDKLHKAPGASYYGEKPVPEGTATKKTGALTKAIPKGTTKMFRNKETKEDEPFVWDGSKWVPQ